MRMSKKFRAIDAGTRPNSGVVTGRLAKLSDTAWPHFLGAIF